MPRRFCSLIPQSGPRVCPPRSPRCFLPLRILSLDEDLSDLAPSALAYSLFEQPLDEILVIDIDQFFVKGLYGCHRRDC